MSLQGHAPCSRGLQQADSHRAVEGEFLIRDPVPFKDTRVTSISSFRALILVDGMKEFLKLPKQLVWNRFLPDHARHGARGRGERGQEMTVGSSA